LQVDLPKPLKSNTIAYNESQEFLYQRSQTGIYEHREFVSDEFEIRITTKSEASQKLCDKLISYLIDEGFVPYKKRRKTNLIAP